MSEALLNEPQTPTDGQTAAQPDAPKGAPASATETKAPEAKVAASEKQQTPAVDTKKEAPPMRGLVTEPEAKKAEGEAKPEAKTDAPEKWELKNGEGDQKVAPALLTTFEKGAKEAGMTAPAAQKLFDSLRTAARENEQKAIESTVRGWSEALHAHPTLGGDKYDETIAEARKALNEFGTPELRELLLKTGFEHHPEVVGLLYRLQKKVGGDRIVTGAPPKGNAEGSAKAFYDRMPKG